MKTIRSALLAGAFLGQTACITGMGYSSRDRVTFAAREYNDGVRWGRLEQASTHLAKEKRQRFVEQHAALEDDLEIADYELVSLDVDSKRKTAVARVNYLWSTKRQGILEKTSTNQSWAERDGEWILERETRIKGVPLALFEELKSLH